MLSARAIAAQPDNGSLIKLEASALALETALSSRDELLGRRYLSEAIGVWKKEPHRAAALLRLAASDSSSPTLRNQILLELARVELSLGRGAAAQEHFVEVSKGARADHQVVAAFEGFVRAAQLSEPIDVPAVQPYLEAIGGSAVDPVARETLYRLGRLLVLRGDSRAHAVLGRISKQAPEWRRSLYLRGVQFLNDGSIAEALVLFDEAAKLPVETTHSSERLEREREVRDLAWLAVARLSFEIGDEPAGIFAYQQVPTDSDHFADAYLELGWMALDSGRPDVAERAFEAVLHTANADELGWRAQLLEGFVLLRRGEHRAAEDHYHAVAERMSRLLERFERDVAEIQDVTVLVHECETRRWVASLPHLAPILERPELQSAREAELELEEIRALGQYLDAQVEELDSMLAGHGAANPFVAIERDRERVETLLEELDRLSSKLDAKAARAGWIAGRFEKGVTCCSEPRLRTAQARNRLEVLLQSLREREESLRRELTGLRENLAQLRSHQRALHGELVTQVDELQREAVEHAISKVRQRIRRMLLEGEAGALEAVWQFKERQRDEIQRLEIERNHGLQELYEQFRHSLGED